MNEFRVGRAWWSACVCALLLACGPREPNVKEILITEENSEDLFEEIKDTRQLSVEEVGLLQAHVLRSAIVGAGASLPVGKTVGELIERERQLQADDELARAEEAKRKAQEEERRAEAAAAAEEQREGMREAAMVTVYEKGFYDGRVQDAITIKLSFENSGDRDVRAFKGVVVFKDVFGDVISRVSLKEDEGLAAGKTIRRSRSIDYNQFDDADTALRATDLEDMSVEWEPDTIIFADGEELRVE